MMVSGIVMRPVDERRPAAIVHHLAADLDAIAGLHRTSRRDADVVHDLDTAGAGLHVEGLVHRVRARSIEKAWRRAHGCRKIDPRRSTRTVGGSQIHRLSDHAQRRDDKSRRAEREIHGTR